MCVRDEPGRRARRFAWQRDVTFEGATQRSFHLLVSLRLIPSTNLTVLQASSEERWERSSHGGRQGPELNVSVANISRGHKSGTPPPVATVPNVDPGKLTQLPRSCLAPCCPPSWHDGGYVLTMQVSDLMKS